MKSFFGMFDGIIQSCSTTNLSEPGVFDDFEKVYDTPDLIVSFDAINFGFPKYPTIDGLN